MTAKIVRPLLSNASQEVYVDLYETKDCTAKTYLFQKGKAVAFRKKEETSQLKTAMFQPAPLTLAVACLANIANNVFMARNTGSHLFRESLMYKYSFEKQALYSKAGAIAHIIRTQLLSSKEDAYMTLEGTARKAPNQPVMHSPNYITSAHQLLDPKSSVTNHIYQPDAKSTMSASQSRPASLHDYVEGDLYKHLSDSRNFPKRDHDTYEGQGTGSFIERLHGVSQREDRPQKKQKAEKYEALEDDKKVIFQGGGKGGELGEYVKQKKEEGLEQSRPESNVVDLTGGMSSALLSKSAGFTRPYIDDGDDVVVLSESNTREVCYGRLDSTKVHAHQIPTPSGKAIFLSRDWPVMKLQLKRLPGKDNIIRVLDPTGRDFGNVDTRTSIGLARIMDNRNPKFRTQAKLQARKRKQNEIPGQDCSEYFDMVINLYGPKNKAQIIGKWLSQRQIYLRTPFTSDAGIEICNPHAPPQATPRTDTSLHVSSKPSSSGYVSRTVEEIRTDVVGMFDNLQQSDTLPEIEADPRITTELLSHQKQGLYFLEDKEKARVFGEKDEDNNSLWRLRVGPGGQRSYYNIITGHEEHKKPPEVLGGILADMMGLGKTLTILALVVGSLDDAKRWGSQTAPKLDDDKALIRNSKTTLLVAPLSTLANWEDQIATHVKPGTLNYYIYHGANRISDLDQLARYDMVITTYSIVSSDFLGRGSKKHGMNPLLQTNFYRIVLDEAHMIREQSTRQSQAVCTLSAQRRWAVTGTPVQNRLEDLGALIKFLRIKPFSEKGGFAQFILTPFKNADPEILPKLRLLVDSFTLRRLKDRIDLPGRHDQVIRLQFSEEERRLYDWFSKDSEKKVRIIANDQLRSLGGKTYAHILRAIMRLRLICAHGRELLSEDDLKITEGFSSDNAIDIDSDDPGNTPSLTPRQAYEMLMLAKETGTDTCVSCTKTVEPREGEDSDGHEIIGCMLPCYQILCRDCVEGVKASLMQNSSSDHHFKCPFCQTTLRTSFFELTKEGIEEADEARSIARQNPRQAKILGRYGGPHTKVKALIDGLRVSAKESECLPVGEQPIKSVVFSGWTANLDLIQIALEDNDVKYARLDGRMSRKARNASLEAFRDDPAVRVILISIMAGGLGLNLTSASKVYVMEPQFNPAAEAQAVDRIHRLGQRREVFTYRLIMDNSFEEKMLDLQRKKQNLADLSMNRGKLDKAEAVKRKLDELRSLFR
ncbi:MAG: hypothetical protein Q9163_003134 [Psora crenata]